MSVTLNSQEFLPTQKREVREAVDRILDDFMIPLVTFTIIEEIKSVATAANIPKGFIDGVKFRKTGPNKGQIINTWGTDELPLAIFFNYGTVDHWVEPRTAKVLAFEGQGTNASAIYFKGSPKPDGVIFSKGHYVSGVPRTEAMEIGFRIGKKRLAEEAGRVVQKELHFVS
jgi:hypothetical protein